MDGTEAAVLELVVGYLGGGQDVDSLEEAITCIAWDMPSALANRVEHILLDRDVLSDEELRDELTRAIGTIVIQPAPDRTSSAHAETISLEFNLGHATGPSSNEIIQRHLVASAHS